MKKTTPNQMDKNSCRISHSAKRALVPFGYARYTNVKAKLMKKFIPLLMLLSLLGCKESAEEISFFPVSKECKPGLDQYLNDINHQYAAEGGNVFSQYEYFKLDFPISSPYIGTVKIYGNKLGHKSRESIANVSSALCVRTEQMEVERDLLGFRVMRDYLLSNLKDGETASIKIQGDKIVVSITKHEKPL